MKVHGRMGAPKPKRLILWALGKNGHLSQLALATSYAKNEQLELIIVVSDNNARLADYLTENCKFLVLASPKLNKLFLFSLKSIISSMRQLRMALQEVPVLIHITMTSPYDVIYLPFLRRSEANVIVTVHDGTRHPGEENFALDLIDRLVLYRADAVVTLTKFVAQTVCAKIGRKKPIDIVANGIVSHRGKRLPPRKFPVGRPIRILFLGRIIFYKGLDLLLDATKLLKSRGINFELSIAGRGDLVPYLKVIADLEVVVENGWVSEERFDELLSSSDIVVLPYREASQSGIAYNAFNASLPVIATPVGGLPESIKHGYNGIIVPEISAPAIADSIAKLISDHELYELLSVGAYDTSFSLSPEETSQAWLQYYEKACAKYFV